MPILSVYFGSSEVSFLVINGPEDYKVFNYPYISENENFLKDLVKLATKELGIKLSDCDVLTCGFPEVLGGFLNPKMSYSLEKVIPKISNYFTCFVDNFTVITPNGFLSCADISELNAEDVNALSNLLLYRNVIQTDTFDQINVDNMIRFFPKEITSLRTGSSVLFSGDRFSSSFKDDAFSYLLMFDLIKTPGIFQIKLDKNNMLANLVMVSMYNQEFPNLAKDRSFLDVGCLVNAPGGAEILRESQDGSSQLVDVKAGEVFIIPVLENTTSRIVVKSQSLGNVEKIVSGGRLGLIIDTRAKNDPKLFNKGYFERNYKTWETSIEEIYVHTNNSKN